MKVFGVEKKMKKITLMLYFQENVFGFADSESF